MGSDGGLSADAEVISAVDSVLDDVAKLVKECSAFQEAVSSHSSRLQSESDVLSKQAVELVASMKQLQAEVYAASEKKDISHGVAEKVPFYPPLIPLCILVSDFLCLAVMQLCGRMLSVKSFGSLAILGMGSKNL